MRLCFKIQDSRFKIRDAWPCLLWDDSGGGGRCSGYCKKKKKEEKEKTPSYGQPSWTAEKEVKLQTCSEVVPEFRKGSRRFFFSFLRLDLSGEVGQYCSFPCRIPVFRRFGGSFVRLNKTPPRSLIGAISLSSPFFRFKQSVVPRRAKVCSTFIQRQSIFSRDVFE